MANAAKATEDQTNQIGETPVDPTSDNAVAAPANLIPTQSDLGKRLAETLGDTSRVVIDSDAVEALVDKVIAVDPSLPVAYAGGSLDKVTEASEKTIVAFIARQEPGPDGRKASCYTCLAVAPMFSLDTLVSHGEAACEWITKLIEKETAHVAARPLRTVEPGEEYAPHSYSMPTSVDELIAQSRRSKIDTSALALLWPAVRTHLVQQLAAIEPFLPPSGAAGIATMSKAIRSKDWAERNLEALEARGIIAKVIIPALLDLGEDGWTEEDGSETVLNLEPIRSWAENRDHVVIEAIRTRTPADESALDDLIANMGQDDNDEG